ARAPTPARRKASASAPASALWWLAPWARWWAAWSATRWAAPTCCRATATPAGATTTAAAAAGSAEEAPRPGASRARPNLSPRAERARERGAGAVSRGGEADVALGADGPDGVPGDLPGVAVGIGDVAAHAAVRRRIGGTQQAPAEAGETVQHRL